MRGKQIEANIDIEEERARRRENDEQNKEVRPKNIYVGLEVGLLYY